MLTQILEQVLNTQSVIDKLNIYNTHNEIGKSVMFKNPFGTDGPVRIPVGDDCAAIPDGHGGYLLFSAEGMIPSFIESSPWFAGYSAVMVNVSDVCAMGGLPLAVTDVIWLQDESSGKEIWAGMKAASEAYGIPIVGGHTCYRSEKKHLAVSVLGKANHLLTSYDAGEGDTILMAIDLNGRYFENYPFWNASTTADNKHLKTILRLMYEVSEKGLAHAAKDISMGGIIGTLGMLLRTSDVGANIYLDKIPKPAAVTWERWLVSFPSFGYLITAKPGKADEIKALFRSAQIACEEIGEIIIQHELVINYKAETIPVQLK